MTLHERIIGQSSRFRFKLYLEERSDLAATTTHLSNETAESVDKQEVELLHNTKEAIALSKDGEKPQEATPADANQSEEMVQNGEESTHADVHSLGSGPQQVRPVIEWV